VSLFWYSNFMPFFRTTHSILKAPWESEYFDPNWMDSDTLVLPPSPLWDYAREMQVEDVDIWEILWQAGGGWGVYAAWCPYAEFYLITHNVEARGVDTMKWETFYGKGAQERLKKRLDELSIPYSQNKIWVDPEEMHLYE
jgi:hypothetical protein